ncbi:putative membrane protein [Arthrobacter bambusae]|nr:putative membrane protein [Arthrobacter bambusae]
MGILGLATPWLPIRGTIGAQSVTLWLPFLGIVFAPLAIVLAGIEIARARNGTSDNKAMAMVGLTLGGVYLVLLAGAFVFVLLTNT